jgi:hypothetical protein
VVLPPRWGDRALLANRERALTAFLFAHPFGALYEQDAGRLIDAIASYDIALRSCSIINIGSPSKHVILESITDHAIKPYQGFSLRLCAVVIPAVEDVYVRH